MNIARFGFTVALLAGSALTAYAEGAHWNYQGAKKWGALEPGYAMCGIGKEQSPIDIRGAKKAELKPIDFAYTQSTADIVNNGHTIQINLADAGAVKLDGVEYKLLQFHFHTPSEEKVKGRNYSMVAHLVHKNAEGKLAVVAVLFKQGKENAALKAVFDGMPAKEGETKALASGINLSDLLPADRGYYKFVGSLTTPPCSEGVRWQVLKQPVELSKGQLAAFRGLYKMNARPVQPLNGRAIEES